MNGFEAGLLIRVFPLELYHFWIKKMRLILPVNRRVRGTSLANLFGATSHRIGMRKKRFILIVLQPKM
ncbi:MAG: hypothetical protein EAZ77_01320 [Nostocales cyanobacterium]|nr:MAG: hypothetical protein EAZ77_01320 [Nostocales cyanobacterium]